MEEQPAPEAEDDPFADSDEWIAAEVRQLFRALSAFDPKAVEVSSFYLHNFVSKTAGRHLHRLPRWQLPGLWFDDLDAPEFNADVPGRLCIRAWLVCVAGPTGEQDWWREPFAFEVWLCPHTGRFRGYRLRIGDPRPRADKRIVGLEFGMTQRIELSPFRVVELPPRAPEPVGGWLEEIVRGELPPSLPEAERGAAPDTAMRFGSYRSLRVSAAHWCRGGAGELDRSVAPAGWGREAGRWRVPPRPRPGSVGGPHERSCVGGAGRRVWVAPRPVRGAWPPRARAGRTRRRVSVGCARRASVAGAARNRGAARRGHRAAHVSAAEPDVAH